MAVHFAILISFSLIISLENKFDLRVFVAINVIIIAAVISTTDIIIGIK